jgi:Domain of unknown function (DUF6268)
MTARVFAASLALMAWSAASFAAGGVSVSEELDAEYYYIGGAHTRGVGDVDEHSADVRYVISPQVTKNLLLRAGAEWQRFSFGVPRMAPVPDVLQQASLVLGFDYQFAEQWIMRAEVQPGLYSDFHDIRWDDVDAPLIVGAVYLVNADLQWTFGMRVDARSQYPVLPAAGVRWKFEDQWTLNFVFPNPRLEYQATDNLLIYFGADSEAGTYRVGEHFGDNLGQPKLTKLDNAELDYLELRIGPGISWRVIPSVTIEAEAGFMPYRSFDFFDRSTVERSYDAPYGQIAVHARF